MGRTDLVPGDKKDPWPGPPRMIAILPELGSLLPMTILVFVTGRSKSEYR